MGSRERELTTYLIPMNPEGNEYGCFESRRVTDSTTRISSYNREILRLIPESTYQNFLASFQKWTCGYSSLALQSSWSSLGIWLVETAVHTSNNDASTAMDLEGMSMDQWIRTCHRLDNAYRQLQSRNPSTNARSAPATTTTTTATTPLRRRYTHLATTQIPPWISLRYNLAPGGHLLPKRSSADGTTIFACTVRILTIKHDMLHHGVVALVLHHGGVLESDAAPRWHQWQIT